MENTKAVVIRPGFSTHAMNFGQRYLELRTSWTATTESEGILHVSQMPNNPNIFQPGPALLFITVDGIPSYGHWVNIGSGEIGQQPTYENSQLEPSSDVERATSNNNSSSSAFKSTVLPGFVSIIAIGVCATLTNFL